MSARCVRRRAILDAHASEAAPTAHECRCEFRPCCVPHGWAFGNVALCDYHDHVDPSSEPAALAATPVPEPLDVAALAQALKVIDTTRTVEQNAPLVAAEYARLSKSVGLRKSQTKVTS